MVAEYSNDKVVLQVSTSLTHQAYKVNQLQCYEADAAQSIGINLLQLMQRAGAAVLRQIVQRYPNTEQLLIVCGKGNNGGDGYVIATLAHEMGIAVTVVVNGAREVITGDAKQALQLLEALPVKIDFYQEVAQTQVAVKSFQGELLVDCLFGIGFKGLLSPAFVQLITEINAQRCPIVSVDVPSGLNADLGTVSSVAVKANLTVTLIAYKQGLLTGQAANYVGNLQLETLGVNQAFSQLTTAACFRQTEHNLPPVLPRQPCSHKGNIGMLLAVGGFHAFTGAICLAAESALRSGAALLSVCCDEKSRNVLLTLRPELMVIANSAETLKDSGVAEKVKAIILGPGLGKERWSRDLFDLVIQWPQPKVIDADALRMLAAKPIKNEQWVLTPHPGEAADLLACSIAEIEADRFSAVKKIAQKYGGICVLKGSGTLVSDGEVIWINSTGNPGMASGGMGDVLSGIIGALILQSSDLFTAARTGVYIHGRAADIIAKKQGQIGMLASDLSPEIQRLINGNYTEDKIL
ncbi:NAD(P)H-hydrate dehydratase [Colwellia sp. Arc7-635]|uniref:NAD(P)H-hydrate dehydratase n=1 Tax=Colwellia sp. Arc7-635 TaxID=2497879 RepID=UPI000F85AF8F|nr:NAD(P)H-hydrate dehydratase [Colwellia sp. Arc7-635]AZQ82909.1 NAD(P)H-hydrate dehydratase [Colwellia sp. Arc7-635]